MYTSRKEKHSTASRSIAAISGRPDIIKYKRPFSLFPLMKELLKVFEIFRFIREPKTFMLAGDFLKILIFTRFRHDFYI